MGILIGKLFASITYSKNKANDKKELLGDKRNIENVRHVGECEQCVKDKQCVSEDKQCVNEDEQYVNKDEQRNNEDKQCINKDEQRNSEDKQYINEDEQYDSDDTQYSSDNDIDMQSHKCFTVFDLKSFGDLAHNIKLGEYLVSTEINLDEFWNMYSDHIFSKCKDSPSDIVKFGINLLCNDKKSQYIETFALKIFNKFREDSIFMCKDNVGLISYNIGKGNKKNADLAKMIECKNIDDIVAKKIKLNAYVALQRHRYGIAYLLFRILDDKNALRQIYDNYVNDYIKTIINFESDFGAIDKKISHV